VGIVAPTLHCVRLLVKDLQNIADAPDAVKALTNDLQSVGLALASVQAVTDPQWKSLGETVTGQSKAAITSCKDSCERFKTSLDRWTRHSTDGTLSWRDRATLGIFRQGHVKSISEQLQNCKITLTSVASIATLHSSLQQTQAAEETKTTISTKETAVRDTITATDKQLAEVNTKLVALCLARQEPDETEADRMGAISQVAVEQTALRESRQLLEELRSVIQTVATSVQIDHDRVINSWGANNEGMQIGASYAPISGITFGRKA